MLEDHLVEHLNLAIGNEDCVGGEGEIKLADSSREVLGQEFSAVGDLVLNTRSQIKVDQLVGDANLTTERRSDGESHFGGSDC